MKLSSAYLMSAIGYVFVHMVHAIGMIGQPASCEPFEWHVPWVLGAVLGMAVFLGWKAGRESSDEDDDDDDDGGEQIPVREPKESEV